MTVSPLSIAARAFRLTIESVSKYNCRRSECPTITYRAPTSRNMKAATSPVCAPSSTSVEQSWPATLMFEPSSRSATVLIAVKTGAITTSEWLAFGTSCFRASAVSTASPSDLYIFQFPAITGLRISKTVLCVLYFVLGTEFKAQRAKHEEQSSIYQLTLQLPAVFHQPEIPKLPPPRSRCV